MAYIQVRLPIETWNLKVHDTMSTKYGIQSLGFIGLLAFGAGLYGYWQALEIRRTVEQSGDVSKLAALHILTITSEIELGIGTALMLMALIFYLIRRRWNRNAHDLNA